MEAKPLISPAEAKLLIDLLDTHNIRGNILEIGSYSCDGSTLIFTEHIREHGGSLHMADLFCIDGFEERCRTAAEGIDARILKGFSAELASDCSSRYQFAFIDGDHGFPRILANGHQSGVACDITAWHQHLEVGGIMAFHDYTGDKDNYGEAKYLPIEYAVDSLCAPPLYEFAGRAEKVIAFRKIRDGVLMHTHKPKKAPAAYRDTWQLLDEARASGQPVTLFGSDAACQRVAESFLTAFPGGHPLAYCPLGDEGSVPNVNGLAISQDELFGGTDIVITAGTAPEEKQILELLDATASDIRPVTFMEWFGWFFLGRYGYL